MRYTPSSPGERQEMLSYLGLAHVRELYKDLPEGILLKKGLKIGAGVAEQELIDELKALASKNDSGKTFLGAGCYSHYLPAALNHIISRSEIYTSYTPYQAEVSQGVLQALFEYQSMICELTGQEASNASMYDGSTALAEACVMAHRITKRERILVSDTLHPQYRQVLKTYCGAAGLSLDVVETTDGKSANLAPTKETAAVVVQSPNFFGIVEDAKTAWESAHDAGAISIACVVEASSLGLLKPPKADITCGEGQALGNPMSFGGPSFGFLSTSMEHVRQMPGRLVGETLDTDGTRAYCLTLQAREQHIRREKATSNICTSQSLCAISAAAYLALLGPEGLKDVAMTSHKNALYLANKLSGIDGFELVFDGAFYNEFLLRCPNDSAGRISEAGYVPGFDVSTYYPGYPGCMLMCSTETHDKSDLDSVAEALS